MSEAAQFFLVFGLVVALVLAVSGWILTREQPEERLWRDYSVLVQKLTELERKRCEDCPCRRKEGTCTGTGK